MVISNFFLDALSTSYPLLSYLDMSTKTCIVLLLILPWVTSCEKESNVDENYIDSDLTPYFESFVEEAAKRGINLEPMRDLVSGYIEEIEDGSVSGQCRHDANAPDKVIIDRTFWRTAGNSRKEFLVFHELGHCMLGRSHLDTRDRNGVCVSIMHSSSDVCSNGYSYSTRAEYLDELFSN